LSETTNTNGRSTVRRNKTMMRALAAAERPVTLIRPALSRRWEAARVKAGNCSTSAKSSRTNGKSILFNSTSQQNWVLAEWSDGLLARLPGGDARRSIYMIQPI
jgi:hypothetical protein